MNAELTKEQVEYLFELLRKTNFVTDNPNTEAVMIGDIELQLQKAEESWSKAMKKIRTALIKPITCDNCGCIDEDGTKYCQE